MSGNQTEQEKVAVGQRDITKEEYEFRMEAAQGNTQRNIKLAEKTNSDGIQTRR